MRKIFIIWMLILVWQGNADANNVRITSPLSVDRWNIKNGIAILELEVAWDNSWRDDYNWDAVYLFFKCKRTSEATWNHVYLRDVGHSLSDGYTYWMAKNPANTAQKAMGMFIYKTVKEAGPSVVTLQVRWPIANNGYTAEDFKAGLIEYEASAIEMVYVPKGPFVPGDQASTLSYQKIDRQILPQWDLIGKPGVTYRADYYKGDPTMDYSPQNVGDRINDTRAGSDQRNALSHAWYSDVQGPTLIEFDLGAAKKVLYIGVEGVAGSWTSHRPTSWTVEGSTSPSFQVKYVLGTYTAADWTIGSLATYPTQKAVKIQTPGTYRYYRIRVLTNPTYTAIRNVSMTDVDLATVTNDAYVIDGAGNTIVFNATSGLNLNLPINQPPVSGSLQVYNPVGYEGFYAMKYEISQEQYVSFLNKLVYDQQKVRTVGEKLSQLEEKDYVYGKDPSSASYRNGIILGRRKDGRCVFTCNLDKSNDMNQASDGQNIACNYLSPADMLAYAAWTGLRPLSELEYEKMARQGWQPDKGDLYRPQREELAWGASSGGVTPTGDNFVTGTAGKPTEKMLNANLNAGGAASGPVRCGSFASGAASREKAGAGFYGVMELSGNLAEMYYEMTPAKYGLYNTLIAHGNGTLEAGTGNVTGMTSYWSNDPKQIILRGGSFLSNAKLARTSDRSQSGYFSDMNRKDSTVTFRVGHSVTNLLTGLDKEPLSYLTLKNGLKTALGQTMRDTVCSEVASYTIRGSELLADIANDISQTAEGQIQYIWYTSTNNSNWFLMPGEAGKDLTIKAEDLKNRSGLIRTVYYMRKAYTPTQFSQTGVVELYIVNNDSFISDQDYEYNLSGSTPYELNASNHANGMLVETRFPADYTWSWKKTDGTLKKLQETKNVTSDYLTVIRDSFNTTGAVTVVCDVTVWNRCRTRQELRLNIAPRPSSGIASNSVTLQNCGTTAFKDSRDNEIYTTVKIGNQCWMAENLRYVTEQIKPKTMYSSMDPKGKVYGVEYLWTAMPTSDFCPAGWSLPSNADFNALIAFLGQDGESREGMKLKTGNYWTHATANRRYRGTNESGFGAMGGGFHTASNIGTTAYFITLDNYIFAIGRDAETTGGFPYHASSGYYTPVRCIKK